MSKSVSRHKTPRHAATSVVTVVLLVAIFLTLVALLIAVIAANTASTGPVPPPPPPPVLIGNPDRIKEVVQAGKTYESLLKGGFDARVEDKDWGVVTVVNLGFVFEMQVARTIESNDGHQIVELRHFQKVRMVKLLSEADVSIDLGAPGVVILGALDQYLPGTSGAFTAVKPIAERILSIGAKAVADDKAAKASAAVAALSGTKVRITFVDAKGVISVVPVECQLADADRDFIVNTAVLSDYYILPDVKVLPGSTWSLDGSQLIGYLDPSFRGVPRGIVIVKRDADHDSEGKQYANLHIESGYVDLDSSDAAKRRYGSFTPRGTLHYNVSDGFVETANLEGKFVIEQVSKDHLLFEARFKSQPTLKIQYSCTMR
jgi:hypothetical protein